MAAHWCIKPSRTGARGELVFSLEICANGQEYYRVGWDGSGDRKEEVYLVKKCKMTIKHEDNSIRINFRQQTSQQTDLLGT